MEIPASNIKKELTKILFEKGYILSYKFVDDDKQGVIKVALKYHPETKVSAIKSMKRASRLRRSRATSSRFLAVKPPVSGTG